MLQSGFFLPWILLQIQLMQAIIFKLIIDSMGSGTFIKSLTDDVFLFTIGVRILNQIEKLILRLIIASQCTSFQLS